MTINVIIMTIIIIIQVRESLNQATEFGAIPEDSEYPFPELIVLMGGLIVHFVNHFFFNILSEIIGLGISFSGADCLNGSVEQ